MKKFFLKKLEITFLLFLICFNILFVTYQIQEESFNWIEVEFVTMDINRVMTEHHLPLYYILQKGISSVFGYNHFSLFLLPILSSCGVVLMLFFISKRMFSQFTAIAISSLYTFSLINFHFSRSFEENLFFTFLMLSVIYFLFQSLTNINNNKKFKKHFVLFCLLLCLCVLTHNMGFFVIIAIFICLIIFNKFAHVKESEYKKNYKHLCYATISICIFMFPLYVYNIYIYATAIGEGAVTRQIATLSVNTAFSYLIAVLVEGTQHLWEILSRGGIKLNNHYYQYVYIYIFFLGIILQYPKKTLNLIKDSYKKTSSLFTGTLIILIFFTTLLIFIGFNPYFLSFYHFKICLFITAFLLFAILFEMIIKISSYKHILRIKIILAVITIFIIFLTLVQLPSIVDVEFHPSHSPAIREIKEQFGYYNESIILIKYVCREFSHTMVLENMLSFSNINESSFICYDLSDIFMNNKTLLQNISQFISEKKTYIVYVNEKWPQNQDFHQEIKNIFDKHFIFEKMVNVSRTNLIFGQEEMYIYKIP